MVECSPNGQKTLGEKEKLLVMSNFSFSHSVFKRHVLHTHKNQGLFGKGLTLYQTTKFTSILTLGNIQVLLPFPTMLSNTSSQKNRFLIKD